MKDLRFIFHSLSASNQNELCWMCVIIEYFGGAEMVWHRAPNRREQPKN